MANDARWRLAGLLVGATLVLGACAHGRSSDAADDDLNLVPTSYKADILAGMHAYLNDPTGIRDAGIAEPALKAIGGNKRYVVCLRFNAKQHGNTYAGTREVAAVFVSGRFDRFVEMAHEQCDDASYAPFPELGKLSR
jgi:hypothetical protein